MIGNLPYKNEIKIIQLGFIFKIAFPGANMQKAGRKYITFITFYSGIGDIMQFIGKAIVVVLNC